MTYYDILGRTLIGNSTSICSCTAHPDSYQDSEGLVKEIHVSRVPVSEGNFLSTVPTYQLCCDPVCFALACEGPVYKVQVIKKAAPNGAALFMSLFQIIC